LRLHIGAITAGAQFEAGGPQRTVDQAAIEVTHFEAEHTLTEASLPDRAPCSWPG
jgi:hypothetical protein